MSLNNTITLTLPGGPILALLEKDQVYARGIAYAQAKRFEHPKPIKPWTEVKDCTRPAAICYQNPSRLVIVMGNVVRGRVQSEDCLHVSVAAPAGAKDLPVMVFFHGGAWMSGGGDLDCYNPRPLARKGVVVVTVTYRLGIFGYLPIPDITPANLGLLDQIEALKWVQQNIVGFGGDPTRVTIFGQSAGGDTVLCLLVANAAKGLFSRAVVQSAPLGRFNDTRREELVGAMGLHASKFLLQNPEPTAEELLAEQTELVSFAKSASSTLLPFGSKFGSYPLPPASELVNLVKAAAQDIPILIGYVKDEGSCFTKIDPSHDAAFYTRTLFQDDSIKLHEEINNVTGGSPAYQCNWYPKGNHNLGATHCIELPFLLGDYEDWAGAPMLDGQDAQNVVQRVGSEVKDLWVAFARGGNFGGRNFVIDEDFNFRA